MQGHSDRWVIQPLIGQKERRRQQNPEAILFESVRVLNCGSAGRVRVGPHLPYSAEQYLGDGKP